MDSFKKEGLKIQSQRFFRYLSEIVGTGTDDLSEILGHNITVFFAFRFLPWIPDVFIRRKPVIFGEWLVKTRNKNPALQCQEGYYDYKISKISFVQVPNYLTEKCEVSNKTRHRFIFKACKWSAIRFPFLPVISDVKKTIISGQDGLSQRSFVGRRFLWNAPKYFRSFLKILEKFSRQLLTLAHFKRTTNLSKMLMI